MCVCVEEKEGGSGLIVSTKHSKYVKNWDNDKLQIKNQLSEIETNKHKDSKNDNQLS